MPTPAVFSPGLCSFYRLGTADPAEATHQQRHDELRSQKKGFALTIGFDLNHLDVYAVLQQPKSDATQFVPDLGADDDDALIYVEIRWLINARIGTELLVDLVEVWLADFVEVEE